jgi:N,N'-diacetyllegionaminate synthase
LAAVAMGARVIEKHFTLDRNLPGPDHRASVEPDELALMIAQLRRVEAAMGDGVKRLMPSELNTRHVARKSLVAARAMPAGTMLTATDLVMKRPGTGISPADLNRVLGRKLKCSVDADSVLTWESVGD